VSATISLSTPLSFLLANLLFSCHTHFQAWVQGEQDREGEEQQEEGSLMRFFLSLGGMCDIEPIMALKPPGIPGGWAPYGEGAP